MITLKSGPRQWTAGYLLLFALGALQSKAQFTQGNITVLQAGDGVTTLTNTGNPIILREFSPAGASTYSVAVPTSSANALLISGSASSEGFLSLSADNRYLVFGGYAAALPNATPLAAATASAIPRGIGMVSAQGAPGYSLVATSASFFSANNIRGAAATNSAHLWASGASQGTDYFGNGTPVTVENSKTNLRAIAIFNGQLYSSSQVATGTPTDIGIYAIGSGTPTGNGQSVATVINTGSGSQPAQFYFNSAGTICYVADQRNSAGGGIQKWVQNAGSWSLAYTLPTGTAAIGATGVVADFSGATPKVYATTNESSANRLIAIQDAGAGSTATTLASAPPSKAVFKGLAFSPCIAPSATLSSSNASVCPGQTVALTATASAGSGALSYSWSGPGTPATLSGNSIIATPTASGIYTLSTTNACGTEVSTITVNTYTLASVLSGSLFVCTGSSVTLTAGGAITHTWSTGSTAASIVVTPSASTGYTVSGVESTYSCAYTATAEVSVINQPTVTVSSASACVGHSVTLVAGGANSYTWSSSATGNSITVTPTVTTTYTVQGYVTGCPASVATATAFVNPVPSLTLQANPNYLCTNFVSTSTLSVLGNVFQYSWSGSATTTSFQVVSQPGLYLAIGTDTNGCEATASLTLYGSICEGIATQAADGFMSIYPNPAGDRVTISLSTPQQATLEVMSLSGEHVYSATVNNHELILNTTAFPKGWYIVKFTTKDRAFSKALLIQ